MVLNKLKRVRDELKASAARYDDAFLKVARVAGDSLKDESSKLTPVKSLTGSNKNNTEKQVKKGMKPSQKVKKTPAELKAIRSAAAKKAWATRKAKGGGAKITAATRKKTASRVKANIKASQKARLARNTAESANRRTRMTGRKALTRSTNRKDYRFAKVLDKLRAKKASATRKAGVKSSPKISSAARKKTASKVKANIKASQKARLARNTAGAANRNSRIKGQKALNRSTDRKTYRAAKVANKLRAQKASLTRKAKKN